MTEALTAIGALVLSGVGYLVFSVIAGMAADQAKESAFSRPAFAARRSRHRALMKAGYICAVLSSLAAVLWLAATTSGREADADDARMYLIVAEVLALAAGGLLTLWWRRAGRAAAVDGQQDDFEKSRPAEFTSSLRVIEGSQEGLEDGWHEGEVTVHPGRLDFVVGFQLRDGLRAALRGPPPPISLLVSAVATERQRQPNKGEMWKVNADSEIVELTTATSTLEWAVPPRQLKATLAHLQSGM
jgi:hypothetical protein